MTLRNPNDYRANVGICVFNKHGQVWLGQRMGRSDRHAWQFPQGGLDKGESFEFGALRELWEETGITIAHLQPLGRIEEWLYYDFASGTKQRAGLHFKGQRQRWFAYRFTGSARQIDLGAHGTQEFSRWEWANLAATPNRVVAFKRAVYERIASEFADYAKPAT